jgi:hypothetical protein
MSTVPEKVQAVLTHLKAEGEKPNVALVCRLAGVNRANLYANHPGLIKEIIKDKPDPHAKRAAPVARKNSEKEFARLADEVKILGYACLELKAALELERTKNATLLARLNRTRK